MGRSLRWGTFVFLGASHIHVPSEKRTKLEPTAKRGIFVGYSETSKAFCIYLPSLSKIVLRRDGRFEEDGAFRKSRWTEKGE
jgi:hypothetical protein